MLSAQHLIDAEACTLAGHTCLLWSWYQTYQEGWRNKGISACQEDATLKIFQVDLHVNRMKLPRLWKQVQLDSKSVLVNKDRCRSFQPWTPCWASTQAQMPSATTSMGWC